MTGLSRDVAGLSAEEWSKEFPVPAGKRGVDAVYQVPKKPPLWVNVPLMPNNFVGRESLVKQLIEALKAGDHPALSADGLPGVGKTTLAVAMAHHRDVLAHFEDGVLWADLGPHPDVMHALAGWADALGLDVSSLPDEAERARVVKSIIGQRRLLLVIDDAWQLEVANRLRCGGPNCCHLLTTRDQDLARTFAGAAQVRNVPVLEDDPAYLLLEARAPEACAADPEAARGLSRAVGGLPLALELLGGYLGISQHSGFPDLSAAALAEMADPCRRLALAKKRLGAGDDRVVSLQEVILLSGGTAGTGGGGLLCAGCVCRSA